MTIFKGRGRGGCLTVREAGELSCRKGDGKVGMAKSGTSGDTSLGRQLEESRGEGSGVCNVTEAWHYVV